MRLIYGTRGSGKTTNLIKECAKEKGYSLIVCHTIQVALYYQDMAKDMGLEIPLPISMDEFIKGDFRGKNITSFYIDNADLLLEKLARGVKIEKISITDHSV